MIVKKKKMNNYHCALFFQLIFLQRNCVIAPLCISYAAEKKSKAIWGAVSGSYTCNVWHINRISGVLIVLISCLAWYTVYTPPLPRFGYTLSTFISSFSRPFTRSPSHPLTYEYSLRFSILTVSQFLSECLRNK